ncbi:amidohydrolase family protein, partial [Steroidobacter sp.]|uniref:amidohydrolase family protein n=1 Tax=Steroidobacter sp. TaxID=1978227 RepID=UPI001A5021CC
LSDPPEQFLRRVRETVARGLDEQTALAALTTVPAGLLGMQDQLGTLEPGRRAQFLIADADLLRSAAARIHEVWVDGRRYARSLPARANAASTEATSKPPLPGVLRYPAGEYGRESLPEQPQSLHLRNATVWTQGPQGVLEQADLLVEQGRIKAVGRALKAPANTVEIDARGLHVTPGVIDPHSHAAIDLRGRAPDRESRLFAENALLVTGEVRISDVLKADHMRIYHQLAAGLTSLLVLPGSGTQMVGKGQAIKLRWGGRAADLPIPTAPCAMKSAIGDNATMYAWGGDLANRTRYPHTRMGIMDPLRDAFNRARAYETQYQQQSRSGPPPRRDLRMEALLEVLSGRCVMHIHSHRQDDMETFLEVAREYELKPVFHHASEAYKMAPELAAAGAGSAVASDWWGFKMESLNEIPQNATLLTQQGVLTSLHSDDGDLAYRPMVEAAKSVRNGLTEVQAMNLLTINPARLLGIADRTGSLEVGKDADFVIWSAHPLSVYAQVRQTWIDGRRYFDLDADRQEQVRIERERARMIALIRSCNNSGSDARCTGGTP